jgi:hypothetical protein
LYGATKNPGNNDEENMTRGIAECWNLELTMPDILKQMRSDVLRVRMRKGLAPKGATVDTSGWGWREVQNDAWKKLKLPGSSCTAAELL